MDNLDKGNVLYIIKVIEPNKEYIKKFKQPNLDYAKRDAQEYLWSCPDGTKHMYVDCRITDI